MHGAEERYPLKASAPFVSCLHLDTELSVAVKSMRGMYALPVTHCGF